MNNRHSGAASLARLLGTSCGRRLPRVLAATLAAGLLATAGAAAQAQNLRVMPMGDSITSGWRSTDANGYRGDLYAALAPEVTSLDFVGSVHDGNTLDNDHEGHSGWRIDEVANVANDALQAYRPNLVTLHLGTNDMGQDHDVANAPARLAGLIDQIFANVPDVTIVVATLINTKGEDAALQARVDAYNATIPAIVKARAKAGKHILLVKMTAALTPDDMFDNLHPNDGGYAKMAVIWNKGVKRAITKKWIKDPAPIQVHLWAQQANLCLDVTAGNQANGALVETWDCSGVSNQLWTPQANGAVQIYAGKCLAAIPVPNSPPDAGIEDCNNGPEQQWRFNTDGTVVGVQSNLCLDVNAFATNHGAKVSLWTCTGGPNQKWARLD